MALPALRNIDFSSQQAMDKAWYAHYQDHLEIIEAIKKKFNVTLIPYQIWPFNRDSFEDMLLKHQQYHDDMNSILSLDGTDLQNLDLNDKVAAELWVKLNFYEHQSAALALQI